MQALRLYAGPLARQHIERNGLQAANVGIVPAAAGGPKGLVLGPLDRFIFGHWLANSTHTVHLVGASIGAWRMATACLNDPRAAFERLERDYIAQRHDPPPGRKRPTAQQLVASRGRHVLARDGKLRTPLGYLAAYASNAVHRKALGAWIDRVVFSSGAEPQPPFGTQDFRTHLAPLRPDNFMAALQASCSIPFMLQPVHGIAHAPPGTYWDGGITDYHLHLQYRPPAQSPIVLYPHFQKAVVPGWGAGQHAGAGARPGLGGAPARRAPARPQRLRALSARRARPHAGLAHRHRCSATLGRRVCAVD